MLSEHLNIVERARFLYEVLEHTIENIDEEVLEHLCYEHAVILFCSVVGGVYAGNYSMNHSLVTWRFRVSDGALFCPRVLQYFHVYMDPLMNTLRGDSRLGTFFSTLY